VEVLCGLSLDPHPFINVWLSPKVEQVERNADSEEPGHVWKEELSNKVSVDLGDYQHTEE
jgi:hypothetical protein